MNFFFKHKQFQDYLYLLGCLYVFSITIWGINKGFDFTDEGYAILGLQNTQIVNPGLSNFHLIVKTLFFWINPTLVNIRLLRLFLAISSSLVFFHGLSTFFKNTINKKLLISFILIGNIIPFSFGPVCLSYNSLGAYLLLFFLGLFLKDISEMHKKNIILKLVSGLILSVFFFVRLPNVIVILFIFFLFAVFNFKNKNLLFATIIYLSGFIFGSLFFFYLFENPINFMDRILLDISNLNNLGGVHSANSLFSGVLILVIQLSKFFLISGCIFLAYFLLKINVIKKPFNQKILLQLFKVFFFLYWIRHFSETYRDSSSVIVLVIGSIIYCTYKLFLSNHKVNYKSNDIFIFIILFFTPFFSAFGTGNTLIYNSIYLLPCWSAFLVCFNSLFNIELKRFFLSLFLFSSCYFFYFHYVAHPYRQLPLTVQNKKVLNKGIFLDDHTSTNIKKLKQKLLNIGFKEGDPIIAIYKLPGLIYLLDAISPLTPLSVWDENNLSLFLSKLDNERENKQHYPYLIIKNESLNSFKKRNIPKRIAFQNYSLAGTYSYIDKENDEILFSLYSHK